MSSFPISARRTYLIARQDFIGYIKTWGFWLTVLGPFLGILFGILAPFLLSKSEPTRYATILDETGLHASAIEQLLVTDNDDDMKDALRELAKFTVPQKDKAAFNKALDEQGIGAAKDFIKKTSPFLAKNLQMPESKLVFIAPPAHSMAELEPYLLGTKKLDIAEETQALSGVLHIFEKDGITKAEFWSTTPTKNGLVRLANRYFSNQAANSYLEAAGLNRTELRKIRKASVSVSTFNPAKQADESGGQKVTGKDRIPYIVAAGLSVLLWLTVFNGAYMLLMSMVEEKINKVLEMLLATTRFSEIFLGKLLGVAALTLATLLPWIIVGALGFYAAAQFADGAVADGLAKAMTPQMLIFLPVFFFLGYVFYGSIFIALGALAESMQDASTLMTPMVLVLTACIIVVPIGIAYPDSPLLAIAAWFPFSAPFAAIIRLPSDPPLWETLGSVAVLVASCLFVVWASSRLFAHGILSGGGTASVKAWFSRVVSRKKNGYAGNMTKPDPSHNARLALLKAALTHVPFDGWTRKTLKQAVRDTDLPTGAEELYFPGGPLEMIGFWNTEMDGQVKQHMAELDLDNMRIRDKVTAGVLARLYAIGPFEDAARRALARTALPDGISLGPKILWAASDTIWRAINDQSTDINYYTKRMTLSAVISTSLAAWLADTDPQKHKARTFLDARIGNVMQFETAKFKTKKRLSALPNPIEILGGLRYGTKRRKRRG